MTGEQADSSDARAVLARLYFDYADSGLTSNVSRFDERPASSATSPSFTLAPSTRQRTGDRVADDTQTSGIASLTVDGSPSRHT